MLVLHALHQLRFHATACIKQMRPSLDAQCARSTCGPVLIWCVKRARRGCGCRCCKPMKVMRHMH